MASGSVLGSRGCLLTGYLHVLPRPSMRHLLVYFVKILPAYTYSLCIQQSMACLISLVLRKELSHWSGIFYHFMPVKRCISWLYPEFLCLCPAPLSPILSPLSRDRYVFRVSIQVFDPRNTIYYAYISRSFLLFTKDRVWWRTSGFWWSFDEPIVVIASPLDMCIHRSKADCQCSECRLETKKLGFKWKVMASFNNALVFLFSQCAGRWKYKTSRSNDVSVFDGLKDMWHWNKPERLLLYKLVQCPQVWNGVPLHSFL